MAPNRHFSVQLKRSPHHWPETQQKTLKSLGLSRFGKVIHVEDTPAMRGMLWKVVHAVEVTPKDGPAPGGKRKHKTAAPKTEAAPATKRAAKKAPSKQARG
jgi:ribosomal protein L30